jgi:hypothetical protein
VWPKMLELWELITGRKQHKIGKYGGDFLRKPRPDKGCSATDDDDDNSELNDAVFVRCSRQIQHLYKM